MEKTTNRKNSTSKKVEEQGAKMSEQEKPEPMLNDNTDTHANEMMPERANIAEDKRNEQDTSIETQETQKPIDPFIASLSGRIMDRIYELYGYSITGNVCKIIISQAQQYANVYNININTDIETINIHELYDHIVNIISNGYNLSPLDNNYNDIFLRAVVERYRM